MKRLFLIGIVLVLCSVVWASGLPTHLDRTKLPLGCPYCHTPHGRRDLALLRSPVPQVCYSCHGPNSLLSWVISDVYNEFQKKYHHPVESTASIHRPDEEYPEKDPTKPRHVSCLDCHNVHTTTPDDPLGRVPGFTVYGQKLRAQKVSDVCYRCHADSANLPSDSEDIRLLFDPSNASFHPVEAIAKQLSPSLKPGLTGRTISCTDCHNPHGSDYDGMLIAQYSSVDTQEGPDTYALCYSCHDRTSIITDRTFPWHKLHVVYQSISCSACHDPHGSPSYPGLVRFRADVSQNAQGMLVYIKEGSTMSCYLNCHGVEHMGQQVQRP